ncbi:MAG TPA: triacylglycerol lipase [Spirochaetota bacterium]|nr:triacylglycerol lipase [Spirochaetota bacterium]HOS42016.1 triacylglycerol lipase [Spirochaetota bacterium]HPU87043.1 triacylglycerol lipase [Spirochaetota bacterium]
MKKLRMIALLMCVGYVMMAFVANHANAGGKKASLNLKYPIILAHGYAGSDEFLGCIDYFYGIKNELKDEGADVYAPDLGAFDTSAKRGEKLKRFVLEVLAATRKPKVNIIGHSQGGVTSRYMISNMGMSGKVASLVMISSPNRGTSLADFVIFKLPNVAGKAITGIANSLWGGLLCADRNPNFYAATYELTRHNMTKNFNPNTPDKTGIRYYSYAGKMYGVSANIILTPTWALIRYYDGENDGIVPVASSVWGNWKGKVTGLFGVDHFMEINHLFGNTPGFDAEGFYVKIAKMLQSDGC